MAHEPNLDVISKRTSTPTIETVTAFPIKDGTLQMTTSSLRSSEHSGLGGESGAHPNASKEYKKMARRSPILDPISQ